MLPVVLEVQAVKFSLKRTVWGVVTSATASSCPSDKPSSTSEEKTHYIRVTSNNRQVAGHGSQVTSDRLGMTRVPLSVTFQSLAEVWPGSFLDGFNRLGEGEKKKKVIMV